MRYVSTRGLAPVLNFEQAMMTGLARDGGLYLPETIPTLTPDDIAAFAGLSYEEVALRVLTRIVAELDGAEPRGGAVARLFDSLVARQPASIGSLVARPMPDGWHFAKAPQRRA